METVRHALETAREHGFAEVEIVHDTGRFSATLLPAVKSLKASSSTEGEDAVEAPALRIESGYVGYYQPYQEALQVGKEVHQGSVVAVIASLGIANDVESKVSGEIFEVCVEPSQAVEYGQLLALVRPK